MAREMKLETWAGNMPPISGEGRKARYDEIVTGVAKMFEQQQSNSTQQWARWTNPPATLKKAREILLERAGELRLSVGGEGLRVAKALDEKGGYVVWIDIKRAAAFASSSKAEPAKANIGQKPIEQPQSRTGASTDPRLQKLAKWLARRPNYEATTSDAMQGTGASITILEQLESAGLATIGKDKITQRKVISLTDAGVEVAGVNDHG